MRIFILAIIALFALVAQSALIQNSAASCACGDHDWTDTTSWMGGVVPGPADDVLVSCTLSNECSSGVHGWLVISADVSINSLEFDYDRMGLKSSGLFSASTLTMTGTGSALGYINAENINLDFNGFSAIQQIGFPRRFEFAKTNLINRGVATMAPNNVDLEGGSSIMNLAGAELTITNVDRIDAEGGLGTEIINNEGILNFLLTTRVDDIYLREVRVTNTGTLNIQTPANEFSGHMALDCNQLPGSASIGKFIDYDASFVPPGGYVSILGQVECPNSGFDFPVVTFQGWDDDGKYNQHGQTPYILDGTVNIDAYGSLYLFGGEATIPSTAVWNVGGRLEFGDASVIEETKPGVTLVNCDTEMNLAVLYDGGAIIKGSGDWNIDFHAFESGHWQGTGTVTVKRHYGLLGSRKAFWTQSDYVLAEGIIPQLSHRLGTRSTLTLNNGARFTIPAGISATMQRSWIITTETPENPGVLSIGGDLTIYAGANLESDGGSIEISGSVACLAWADDSDECLRLGGPGTVIEATAEFSCDDIGTNLFDYLLATSDGAPFVLGSGEVTMNGGTFSCVGEVSSVSPATPGNAPINDDFCSCRNSNEVCDAARLREKGLILEADITWASSVSVHQAESYIASGSSRHTLTYSGDLVFVEGTAYQNIDVVVEGGVRIYEMGNRIQSNWFDDVTFLIKGDLHFNYPGSFPPAGYMTTRGLGLEMTVEGRTYLGGANLAYAGLDCIGYDASADTLNFALHMTDAYFGSADTGSTRPGYIAASLTTVSGTLSGNENFTDATLLASPDSHRCDLSDCLNFTLLPSATTHFRVYGTDPSEVESYYITEYQGSFEKVYSKFDGDLIVDVVSSMPISAGMTWDVVTYTRDNNPPFGQFASITAGTGWGSLVPGMMYEPNGEQVWKIVACDGGDTACQSNVRNLMPNPIDLTTTGAPATTTGSSSTGGNQGSTGSVTSGPTESTTGATGATVVTSSSGVLLASFSMLILILVGAM